MNHDQIPASLQAKFEQQFEHLAFVSAPNATGLFKATAADFRVREVLGYSLEGEGPHVYLRVQKEGLNTADVVRFLAQTYKVVAKDIGYSGMKDKQAITEQWFSLPSLTDLEVALVESPQLTVLEVARHRKKLKRGVHRANHFTIRLREVSGDKGVIEQSLKRIAASGVPNYFGPQRFGYGANNLIQAWQWFQTGKRVSRQYRSLYLSAVRSWLFNQVLSARVRSKHWDQLMPSDVMMLNGTNSVFTADSLDEALTQRLLDKDIHPTGPMPGLVRLVEDGDIRQFEQTLLAPYSTLIIGLEAQKVQASRRSLRLLISELSHQWLDEHTLELDFQLQKSGYATVVLRELMKCN